MKGGIVFSRNANAAQAFEKVSRAVLAKQDDQAAGCIPDRSAAGGGMRRWGCGGAAATRLPDE